MEMDLLHMMRMFNMLSRRASTSGGSLAVWAACFACPVEDRLAAGM